MVMLPQNIANVNVDKAIEAAGSGPMPHIPDGVYKAMAVQSELKETKSGGTMLVVKFVITEGQYANTELTERLNIVNDNATAVKIALGTLGRIAKAAGFIDIPQNSDMLLRKPMMIETKTEPGQPYTDSNGVQQEGKPKSVLVGNGYKAIAQAAPAAAVGAATPPWMG